MTVSERTLADIRHDSVERMVEADKQHAKWLYKKFRDGGDVKFDEMAKFLLGEQYELPSVTEQRITTQRQDTGSDNTIKFYSCFQAGSVLKRHYHSDCTEYLTVEDEDAEFLVITGTDKGGDLKFNILNKSFGTLAIPPNVVHQVSSRGIRGRSKIIIEFEKSN